MALAVRVSRARRVRHRKFRGLDRGFGRPRLERLDAWLAARSTALGGTGTGTAVQTVTFADDRLDFAAAHPYAQGDVIRMTTTTTLPSGLALATDYQVIVVDSDSIRLAASFGNWKLQNAVPIADAGTGTHTVTPATEKASLVEWLRVRKPIQIQNATDIDNL